MIVNKKLVKECIFKAPLLLIDLYNKNKQVKNLVDHYIPFSIGMELETFRKKSYNQELFNQIPNIIEVRADSEEQRYRIPSGINGLICLYLITRETKNHCKLDTKGSIHYHVDMTHIFSDIANYNFIDRNDDWILRELDSWGKKKDSHRKIFVDSRAWVNLQSSYKTMEVRIGDMSFEYEYIIKKILHCCSIVRRIHEAYNKPIIIDNSRIVSIQEIERFNKISTSIKYNTNIESLRVKRKELEEPTSNEKSIEEIVKNRIIRI